MKICALITAILILPCKSLQALVIREPPLALDKTMPDYSARAWLDIVAQSHSHSYHLIDLYLSFHPKFSTPLNKKALLKKIKSDFDNYLKSLTPKHCKIFRSEWPKEYGNEAALFGFACSSKKMTHPRFQWNIDELTPKKDIPTIEQIRLDFDVDTEFGGSRLLLHKKKRSICAKKIIGPKGINIAL